MSVSLFDRGGEGRQAKGQVLPEEYNRSSTLQFSVPSEGTRDANFELSSNPKGPPVRRRPGGR